MPRKVRGVSITALSFEPTGRGVQSTFLRLASPRRRIGGSLAARLLTDQEKLRFGAVRSTCRLSRSLCRGVIPGSHRRLSRPASPPHAAAVHGLILASALVLEHLS